MANNSANILANDSTWSSGRSGTTLLEVMVAIGILATFYVALLQVKAGSVRLSTYSKQMTVASFLVQTKMEETEEKLNKDGFPDMDDAEEGNFEDLGYPHFAFKLQVRKIELPLAAAFEQLLANWGGGTDANNQQGIAGQSGGLSGLQDQFGDVFKNKLGGIDKNISGLLNPDMLRGQVDMLGRMLEQAIRELRVTVFWEEGGPGKEVEVVTILVQVPQASAATGSTPDINQGILPPGTKLPTGTSQIPPTGFPSGSLLKQRGGSLPGF